MRDRRSLSVEWMVPLSIASCLVMLFLTSCGDDGTVKPSGEPNGSLVFTRDDGSVVEFPATAEAYVWCGPWEPELVPVPSLHVWFVAISEGPPFWALQAVVGDVEIGEPLFFPNDFIWDQPESVLMFLSDPPNELATDTSESSGSIVFYNLPCPGGMYVDFRIDAVIGSEYGGGPSVAVHGRFQAQVTGPPMGRAIQPAVSP